MTKSRVLLSIQPFGLKDLGGGNRILRTLFEQPPMPVEICNTAPGGKPVAGEYHIARRQAFGRIERTRFGFLCELLTPPSTPLFLYRLEKLIKELGVTDIHTVPHDVGFAHAFDLAKKLKLRIHVSVHDDARYITKGQASAEYVMRRLADVWQQADSRFVISSEMGEEYCARYGKRDYKIVTDGFDDIASGPRKHRPNQLSIYFMGLFHYEYCQNLILLLSALDAVGKKNPQVDFSLKLRCGALNYIDFSKFKTPVTVLGATLDSNVLVTEMAAADLLYLPLQFQEATADFTKFSLSTKLVSYSSSGVPILYHGPEPAAASRLLARHNAALMVPTMDQATMERVLQQAISQGGETESSNALELAKANFRKEVCRSTFWEQILSVPEA